MTWVADLYDDLLADVLLVRADAADTARTLAFLREVLALTPGARVFDQCSGIGSLAIPLAQAGCDVVAVDQAAAYVRRTADDAGAAGVSARVAAFAADARDFVPDRPCDAALNWWTGFGHHPRDEDNARLLACALAALRPGGRFALDAMNVPGILRHFQPEVVVERDTPRGRVTLRRLSRIDAAAGTLHKTWVYALPDGHTVERVSVMRLYLPHTLAELMAAAGFVDLRAYGDVDGSPLELDSRRCIWVAARPR